MRMDRESAIFRADYGSDLSRIPICDEIMEEAKERVKMDTYAVTPRNKE